MRVILIDDHALFRVGLQGLLERRGIDVVAAVLVIPKRGFASRLLKNRICYLLICACRRWTVSLSCVISHVNRWPCPQ